MKKQKEVLPVYDEVVKGKKGWKVQLIVKGKIKFVGRYRTQKQANKKFESLTKKED